MLVLTIFIKELRDLSVLDLIYLCWGPFQPLVEWFEGPRPNDAGPYHGHHLTGLRAIWDNFLQFEGPWWKIEGPGPKGPCLMGILFILGPKKMKQFISTLPTMLMRKCHVSDGWACLKQFSSSVIYIQNFYFQWESCRLNTVTEFCFFDYIWKKIISDRNSR
jgi:hypothetical protein